MILKLLNSNKEKQSAFETLLLDSIINGEHLIFSRLMNLISRKEIWKQNIVIKESWVNTDYQQIFDILNDNNKQSKKFYDWLKKNKIVDKYIIVNKKNNDMIIDENVDLLLEEYVHLNFLSTSSRLILLLKDIKKFSVYFKLIILDFTSKLYEENQSNEKLYVQDPPSFMDQSSFPEWLCPILEDRCGDFLIKTNKNFNVLIFKKLKNINNDFKFTIQSNHNTTPHPPLQVKQIILTLSYFFFAVFKKIKDILFKNNFQIVSLFKIIEAKVFTETLNNNNITTYYLPYSGKVMEDPWVESARKNNIKIINFNYSANLDFPVKGYYNIDIHRARLNSVSNVKIFSAELKENSAFKSKKFNLTSFKSPPVWYWSKMYYKDAFFRNKIAIYDISPHYPTGIGIDYSSIYLRYFKDINSFYTYFFNDILSLCRELEIQVVLKKKRENDQILSYYRNLIFDLEKKYTNFQVLEDTVSLNIISSNSLATISQCFTSTAYYDTNISRNIYYDPTSSIKNGFNKNINRFVISRKPELSLWLKNVKNRVK